MIRKISDKLKKVATPSWKVAGQAFDRETGEPRGSKRTETVTAMNKLFANCDTVQDVHEAYERFWNKLNPNSKEVVFVQQIKDLYN
jgi:hypothetical protein